MLNNGAKANTPKIIHNKNAKLHNTILIFGLKVLRGFKMTLK